MQELRREPRKVVVIGAGVAGLSAAYYLKKHGVEVQVIERELFVGGTTRSILKEDRYILDLGPSFFLKSDEQTNRLVRELSLLPLLINGSTPPSNRYIYTKTGLHKLPTSSWNLLNGGTLSFAGKMRAVIEPLFTKRPAETESLADFVSYRCGKGVLDSVVQPIISNVFAGDSTQLEAQSILPELASETGRLLNILGTHLPNFSDTTDEAISFRWGMGTITARLEEVLRNSIRTGHPVTQIERRTAGLKVRVDNQPLPYQADAVIVALPAHAAGPLFSVLDPELSGLLSSIPYAPIAVIHTAFSSGDIKTLPGFGAIVSRKSGARILSATWSSSVFPGRSPNSEVLIQTTVGGTMDPGLVDLSDNEIMREVMEGLKHIANVNAKPRFTYIRRFARAIPQYILGHRARVQRIEERLSGLNGLFLTGNYFTGPFIEDTITNARAGVDRVLTYLKTRAVNCTL